MLSKMQQNNSKTFTYQSRFHLELDEDTLLRKMAELLSQVERTLFRDIASGQKAGDLKSSYLKRFKITARQFNSCRVQIEGKIDSIHELRKQQIIERRNHIQSLEEKIKKQRNKKARASQLHQKMRRLSRLQAKQRKLEQDHEEKKIRLCFGSKKLFQEQFYLEENGLHSHKEWKEKWQKARNSSFFLLGSKDETAGNQSCKATLEQDDTISLQLRLPDAFITKEKYLTIHNVTF